MRGLAVLLTLSLVVGCSRPSAKDCEEAIRNWYTLVFWEKAEQEIAAAPPEKRDQMRIDKSKEKDAMLEKGITLAINQCRSSRDKDGVKCMKAASTAAEAKKCRSAKDPESK
jgi:hypothetical protein